MGEEEEGRVKEEGKVEGKEKKGEKIDEWKKS